MRWDALARVSLKGAPVWLYGKTYGIVDWHDRHAAALRRIPAKRGPGVKLKERSVA